VEKEYIEITKSADLEGSRDRALFRFFETVPAVFSWGTLALACALSWLVPAAAAIFIIIFDFFWLLRIAYLSFHQTASYNQMKKNIKENWIEKLNSIKNNPSVAFRTSWHDIYHLIILPMYKEGIEIVRPAVQSLAEAEYPKDKMIVVLGTEETVGEKALETAKIIENEFGNVFFRFFITIHPKNILGEIPGKGSNTAWAVKQAKELIIDKLSIPYENIIVSNFDIDTKPYLQYFSCLTWYYLTSPNPLRASYQPIPIYNNNIWQAPAFSRVIATSGTFWQMMQQERQEQLVTYSSHSLPFKVLEEVGYPVDIVSDDSRIFWKSYFYYNGDYRVIPLYYPISMDAVLSKTFLRTVANQYKQQRRWAWGCVEVPYLFFNFLKNKKISLKEKLRHSFVIMDGFWSWATSALLIFFLGWLPLMIGEKSFQASLLSYNLPRLTSNIMTLAMVGMMASAITSLLLLPPRPKNISSWKTLSMVLQWFLLPITLIIFGTFPALDAQMRLFLGKHLGFWVTEKIRK